MQSLRPLAIVAILASAGWGIAAQSDAPHSILEYYGQRDALATNRDASGFVKLMTANATSDYVEINMPDRKGVPTVSNLSKTLEGIARIMAELKKRDKTKHTYNSHITNATITNSSAIVTVSQLNSYGKVHAYVEHDTWKDTWVKAGALWKLKSTKFLSSTATVDGKSTFTWKAKST